MSNLYNVGRTIEDIETNQKNAFNAYKAKQINGLRQEQARKLEKIEDNQAKNDVLKEKSNEISQILDGSTLGLFLTKSMGEKLYGKIKKRFFKKGSGNDEGTEEAFGEEGEIETPLDFLRGRTGRIPTADYADAPPIRDPEETPYARELSYTDNAEYENAPVESVARDDIVDYPLGGTEGEIIPSRVDRLNPNTGLDDFAIDAGRSNLIAGDQQPNLFQRFKNFVSNKRNSADEFTEGTGSEYSENSDFFGNLIDGLGEGERAFPNLPSLVERPLRGGEIELQQFPRDPTYADTGEGETLRSDFLGRRTIEPPEPANRGELEFEPELQDLPEGFRDTRLGQYGFRGFNPEAESKMPELERIPSDRSFNRVFGEGAEYKTADPIPEVGEVEEAPAADLRPVEGFRPPEPDYPPPSYDESTRSSRLTDEAGFGETGEPESYGEAISQKEGTMVKDLPESNVVEGTTIEKAPITAEPVGEAEGLTGELESGIEGATGVGATEAGELAAGDLVASAIPVVGEAVMAGTALIAGAYTFSKFLGDKFQSQKSQVADTTQSHINRIQAQNPHLNVAGQYVGGNTAGNLAQLSQGGSGF